MGDEFVRNIYTADLLGGNRSNNQVKIVSNLAKSGVCNKWGN
jgi:hypothetical protein